MSLLSSAPETNRTQAGMSSLPVPGSFHDQRGAETQPSPVAWCHPDKEVKKALARVLSPLIGGQSGQAAQTCLRISEGFRDSLAKPT